MNSLLFWFMFLLLFTGYIRNSLFNMSRKVILPFYSVLVRYQWVQFWYPQYKKGIDMLKRVHWRATKTIKGLKHLTHEDRLQSQGLFSVENRKLRDISSMHANTWCEGVKKTVKLFSVVASDSTRVNGHKLKHMKIHLNTTKRYFTMTVDKHGNRLPDWTWCWVSCSSWPCLSRKVGLDVLKRSLLI